MIPLGSFQITLFEDGCLAEYIYFASYVEIPAVDDLPMIFLLTRVDLFDVVLGVFDNNLMGLPIEFVNNSYLISLSVLNPPRFEPQLLNIIFLHQTVV